MKNIPFSATLWAIILALPFIYCTVAVLDLVTPPQSYWAQPYRLLNSYGAISLAVSGGIYWGFAAKSRPGILDAIIAMLPPLAALVASFYPAPLFPLAVATAGLIVVDLTFIARGLAPNWWFSLRLFTTTIASGALFIAYYA